MGKGKEEHTFRLYYNTHGGHKWWVFYVTPLSSNLVAAEDDPMKAAVEAKRYKWNTGASGTYRIEEYVTGETIERGYLRPRHMVMEGQVPWFRFMRV